MRFFLSAALVLLTVQFQALAQRPTIQEINGQSPNSMQMQQPSPTGAPGSSKKTTVPTAPYSPTSPAKGSIQSGLGANVFGDDSIRRDPFRLPQYLINKLTFRPPAPIAAIDQQAIDDRVEPIRRWNTKEYTLVGIIWEVKNPKALLRDVQSRVHVIRINDKVGNQEGVVTSIREGAITVSEKDDPVVLRLKK